MYFDRFDICEAHYLFLSHHHEGQWSDKYRRLNKLYRFYIPGPLVSLDNANENVRSIYDALVAKEQNPPGWDHL